jgi:hypothetical protein
MAEGKETKRQTIQCNGQRKRDKKTNNTMQWSKEKRQQDKQYNAMVK